MKKVMHPHTEEERRRCNTIMYGVDTVLDWYPTDDKETFEKQSDHFKKYWNEQKKIEYSLNSYGHREVEIPLKEDRESVMCLGCSNTFGIGHHVDDIWPSIVSNNIGLKRINFAVAGSSLDTAFRLYLSWQPVIKSKVTCVFVPPSFRYELGSYAHTGTWTAEKYLKENKIESAEFYTSYLADKTYHDLNRTKNILAMRKIANETDSKLHVVEYNETTKEDPNVSHNVMRMFFNEKARDGLHRGRAWQAKVASHFMEKINEKDI